TRRSQRPRNPRLPCIQSRYAKMPASALLQVEPVLKSCKDLLNLGNRGQKVLLIAYKGGLSKKRLLSGLSKKCLFKRALVQKMYVVEPLGGTGDGGNRRSFNVRDHMSLTMRGRR